MTRVRLDVDLDELHATIAESFRVALHARGLTVAKIGARMRPLEDFELAGVFAEAGRNAAGALMMFAVEDDTKG